MISKTDKDHLTSETNKTFIKIKGCFINQFHKKVPKLFIKNINKIYTFLFKYFCSFIIPKNVLETCIKLQKNYLKTSKTFKIYHNNNTCKDEKQNLV